MDSPDWKTIIAPGAIDENKEIPLTVENPDGTQSVVGTAKVKLIDGELWVDAVINDPDAAHIVRPLAKDHFNIAPYRIEREPPHA